MFFTFIGSSMTSQIFEKGNLRYKIWNHASSMDQNGNGTPVGRNDL